jgi:hypothetical protein
MNYLIPESIKILFLRRKKMIKYWKGIKVDGKTVSIRYNQKNNSVEDIIRKVNKENGVKVGYLESCGMSACMCLMEGLGYLTEKNYPKINGKMIQMDDWGMMYINDPKNGFSSNADQMDNRAVYNYPKFVKEVFNCESEVFKNLTFQEVQEHIKKGRGVQFLIPGHYIAAGNQDKDHIYYMDSWGSRKSKPLLKNGGDNELMTETDFIINAQTHFIVYYPPVKKLFKGRGRR